MKKILNARHIMALVLTLVMAITIITPVPAAEAASKYVTSLSLSSTAKTIYVGKTTTVKATVKVSGGANKAITATSTKSTVATVKKGTTSSKGVTKLTITGKKAGTAYINVSTYAKNKSGKKLTKKVKVTVKNVAVKSLSNSKINKNEIKVGQSAKITPVITPSNATLKSVSYKSADPSIATVSAGGTVKGIAPGTTKITVSSKAYPTKKKTFTVTVTPTLVLKDITVTASNGTSIPEKGGQTVLTVSSATTGVSVKSVSFKSDNTQVAEVTEEGKVTGVNAGTAIITITATDAAGATVTKNVTITVTQKSNATVTLDTKSYTMYVNDTYTLKPTVTNNDSNEKLTWSSDNEAVATVDENGKVTAVGVGDATITVKVGSSAAAATCEITVKDNAPGISSFKITHADILEVKLNAAIPAADQEKVNITLKMGSDEQTVATIWAADGRSFTLEKKTNYEVGTYVVTLSSQDLTFDPAKSTSTLVVDSDPKVSDIQIVTDYVLKADNSKVYYTILDQYGDELSNVSGDDFTWNVTCSNSEVKTADLEPSVEDGYILLKTTSNAIDVTKDSVSVQAYLTTDPTIVVTKEIPIKALKIQSIKLLGTEKTIYQSNSGDQNIDIKYEAVDEMGQPVDLSVYSSYANEMIFTTTDATICSQATVVDGKLKVTIPQGAKGKATITAVAADKVLSSYTIEVLEAPYATAITYPNSSDIDVVAGEIVRIPVSFTDQYGDAMEAGSVSEADFRQAFSLSTFGALNADMINKTPTYTTVDGDFIVVNTAGIGAAGTLTVRATSNADGTQFDFPLTVKAPRKASVINVTKAPKADILVGQTTRIEFIIEDSYKQAWTDTTTYDLKPVISDDVYFDVTDTFIGADGKGYIDITGLKCSAEATDVPTITLSLVDKNGKTISTKALEYAIIVNNNVQAISATTDAAEYKAGTDVLLTFTAKYENKTLTTYNETIENVEIYEGQGSNVSVTRTLTFKDGVATATVPAQVAQDAVAYYAQITSPGKAVPVEVTSSVVKIVANDPANYSIAETAGGYTISVVDVKGNVVDVDASTVLTVSVVETATGNNVTGDFFAVNSEGTITLNFTDGVAVLPLKDGAAKVAGATITVASSTLKGAVTIK